MKIKKYSLGGATLLGLLSVFLFTACEKETDSPASGQQIDRLEKFKRLSFTSGSTSTSTTNTSSGTFTGGGGNISYTPPAGGGENTFAPSMGSSDQSFTDPQSGSDNFVVAEPFFAGGGTITLDGTSYELDFGFCAEEDFFGTTDDLGGSSSVDEIEVFIGVAGDFDFSLAGDDEPDDLGIDLILFAFSYNGGNSLSSFSDFENGEVDNSAFVIAAEYSGDSPKLYFSTAGNINFNGGQVVLSGVKMTEIEEGEFENTLTNRTVNAQAFLECGTIFIGDSEEE